MLSGLHNSDVEFLLEERQDLHGPKQSLACNF
jgi:hypothetical protein